MKSPRIILFFSLILLLFFVLNRFSSETQLVSAKEGVKIFNKDLKIGDNSEDVKFLQKFLNKNPTTKISSSGTGSSGNETDFFGQLTKNAVIKFQEMYASDVLQPFGLKSGTGFVGTATRLKLNSLLEADNRLSESVIADNSSLSKYSSKSSQSSRNSSKSAGLEVKKPLVVIKNSAESSSKVFSSSSSENSTTVRAYSTSEYQVSPGKTLVLEGEGFTPKSNTVHLGENNSIPDLNASENGTKISFVIPKDLPLGKYSIWVTNANGISKSEAIKIYIVVTNSPLERPVVEKVEPTEATIDSEIVVSGKGFTTSGNNIYSMFGNVMNISSSDGKTLKFKPSSMQQIAKIKTEKSAKNIPIEVSFYIVNENGYNKELASFIIQL